MRPRDTESKSTFEHSDQEFWSQAHRSNFRRCFSSSVIAFALCESMKSRVSVPPTQVSDKLTHCERTLPTLQHEDLLFWNCLAAAEQVHNQHDMHIYLDGSAKETR